MSPTHKQTSGGLDAELAELPSQVDSQSAPGAQTSPSQDAASTVKVTGAFFDNFAGGTNANDIPANNLAEPMLLTEDKYKRMKAARDDDVKTEIVALQNAISELAGATDTNKAVLIMMSSGLIAVGTKMVEIYGAIHVANSLSTAIRTLIVAVGGFERFRGIVAAVAADFLLPWALPNDAVNQLLVINGLQKKINMTEEWIMNGERFKVMLQVPDAETSSRKPYAYGCGFATYRKTRSDGNSSGSTVGIAFKAEDNSRFSVGLNSPSSNLAGGNCIRVCGDLDAKAAATYAARSSISTERVNMNGHTCTGSLFFRYGSINYAICSLA